MKKKIRVKYPTFFCDEKKGRDNKDYYNTRGIYRSDGYKIRVPSLKRRKKIWNNFYKLFPDIKEALMNNRYVRRFGEPTLVGNVYVCKEERVHGLGMFNNILTGVGRRIRTTKFLKTW
ncbi:MAG: hypothetical protein IKO56_04475 [Alphaproteobacteria bacterium]|nr:hypothetical protein [Alphaproteobacteria bacterium]